MNDIRSITTALVKRFGYLRNIDLAQLLYAEKSSATRLAQILTKKLVAAKSLVEHKTPGCTAHYACPGDAAVFKNITGHRDAANHVAIEYLKRGHRVVTEREIQQSNDKEFHGKIPDALIIDEWVEELGGERADYIWVEVENAERSGRDVITFGDWIVKIFTELPGPNWHVLPEYRGGCIQQVLIVISSKKADKVLERLMSYIERAYPERAERLAVVLPERLRFVSIV